MGVETATYISGLDKLAPLGSETVSEGDDHIRLIKATIVQTFPNISGAVTPTHTELNYVDGVTSAIQTQLDAKAPLASPALTGAPTAPTASAGTSTTQIATTAFVAAADAVVVADTATNATNAAASATAAATSATNAASSATAAASSATAAAGSATAAAASATAAASSAASIPTLASGISAWLASPTSANLRAAVTDETGTGALVFAGGAIGAASATSINFGQESLSTYDEFTWTPTLGGTATYSDRQGSGVKVGRMVTLWGSITVNAIGTGSTTTISGLPFAVSGIFTGVTTYFASVVTSSSAILWQAGSSSLTSICVRQNATTAVTADPIFQNSTRVDFSVTYYATA